MKRILTWCTLLFLSVFLLNGKVMAINFDAETEEALSDRITEDLVELIPKEIQDSLPENMLHQQEIKYDSSFFFAAIGKALQTFSKEVLSDFSVMLGILILSSTLHAMRNTLFADGIGQAFSLLSVICMAITLYHTLENLWSQCAACLSNLTSLGNGLIPILVALLTAGGNTAAAAVSATGLSAVLAIIENLTGSLLFPLLRIGYAFSLISCVSGELCLDGLSGLIRKMSTTVLAVAMTAFSAILAFQTKLAASGDSVGARVVRFAIGTVVPMVGSAVNEAIHTVSGSVEYLRSFTGIICIFAIVLLLLPTLVKLFLYKLAFSVGNIISSILGCPKEAKLLGEVRDIMNFAIALLFFCAAVLLVYLTVFLKTSAAISG